MSKNPYEKSDPNWKSFEWDEIIKKFRAIQENNLHSLSSSSIEAQEAANQELEAIQAKMQEFKDRFF